MAIDNAGKIKRVPPIVINSKILDDTLLLYILLPVIGCSFALKANDLHSSLVFI